MKEKIKFIKQIWTSRKNKHVSDTNDYAGYDILSYNDDGTERFIEVKTTKGPINSDFI